MAGEAGTEGSDDAGTRGLRRPNTLTVDVVVPAATPIPAPTDWLERVVVDNDRRLRVVDAVAAAVAGFR